MNRKGGGPASRFRRGTGPIDIVRIGVVLSGCDIGGIAAHSVLRELERQGVSIGMLSVCGIPSVASLLYVYDCDETASAALLTDFLDRSRQVDMDLAAAEFSAEAPLYKTVGKVPLAVSSVHVPDGRICAFTDAFPIRSTRLRTCPLRDTYDVLSSTISPAGALASYKYEGLQLCDFSVWYGIPVYPLKIGGVDRVVSIAFLPRFPQYPYEVLVKQKIRSSSHLADVHIEIESENQWQTLEEYENHAVDAVKDRIDDICLRTLF